MCPNCSEKRCKLVDAIEATVWRRVHRLATRPPSGDASTVWRRVHRLATRPPSGDGGYDSVYPSVSENSPDLSAPMRPHPLKTMGAIALHQDLATRPWRSDHEVAAGIKG